MIPDPATVLRFLPLPTDQVRAYQSGAPDAYGLTPERVISDGTGVPCRHCLCDVPRGQEMLILAHRPFAALHAYAETGPIFLCATQCGAYVGRGAPLPDILTTSPDYLLKGYGPDERIVYGTGRITPSEDIAQTATAILARADVAFVDIRSARNNCFQLRVVAA
ncbi:DUF1203 domain-containing protein [Roseovarius sp. LXJ103]|uniref:DUF1203 domain-containing protein n=1 Tax=Roseovarius carneus TaxID=2853164 RepID=UPI000D613B67|nr:DUF1203 domain-containing protein [Roseovarius carneus]MBZ8117620.1 DUF1203 domain-containing protein [Roseovarius carneus]PWE36593.1 DUF1203 domain-containing protein [Pelagicola sp. LXJ1103]